MFRPGRENCVADWLSRSFDETETALSAADTIAVADENMSDNCIPDVDSDDRLIATVFGTIGTTAITLPAVAQATASDDQLSRVRNFIVNGRPAEKRVVQDDLRTFYAIKEELSTALEGQCHTPALP